MSDIDILDEFAPSDTDSEWSEDNEPIQEEVKEEEKEEEIVEEESHEIQKTEEESEYSEYSELEEEKEEDKQKIVEEEFVLPEMKEEEIENVDIDLTEENGNNIICFSIMFLSKCFIIRCSSEISVNVIISKISELVNIKEKYLCLRSIDSYDPQSYTKSLRDLGIKSNFILSISLSFPLLIEGETKEIEITECKDMNDLYVSLLHELDCSSCQLFINSKEIKTLQYPPLPLSFYFSNDITIEVKKDVIINVVYHNTTMPLFLRDCDEYRKIKSDLVCYNLYKIIQKVLDISYPIVILCGKQVIYPNKLVPESNLKVIQTLNVYDLFINIPSEIPVLEYTTEVIEGYGKDVILTVDLDISECSDDVLKEFIIQFSDIVDSKDDDQSTKAIITPDSCILESSIIANCYYDYFQENMRIPACVVNNNYQYKHPQAVATPEVKPAVSQKRITEHPRSRTQNSSQNSSNYQRRNFSTDQRNESYQNNYGYSPRQGNMNRRFVSERNNQEEYYNTRQQSPIAGTPRRRSDCVPRDYQRNDGYQRNGYQKNDGYQRRDDYQRNDYQRNDYQRNDYQRRNDYQKDGYQRRDDYQRNDGYQRRDDYQRRDYQQNDYQRNNQRRDHQQHDNQRDPNQRNNQRTTNQNQNYQRNNNQQQGYGKSGQQQRNNTFNRQSQQSNQRSPTNTHRRRSDQLIVC